MQRNFSSNTPNAQFEKYSETLGPRSLVTTHAHVTPKHLVTTSTHTHRSSNNILYFSQETKKKIFVRILWEN